MIKHEGGKWCLYSQDGSKKLGEHDTKAEAEAQERAIEASKARRRNASDHEGHLISYHLVGAAGAVRTEIYQGREHFVIPVVALMEGVIHAVNADNPEFVPLTTLEKAASSWNGRPVVVGHPIKNGRQCSANSPDVLATYGIGTIFNSRVEGNKLLQEAWLDKEKTRKLHRDMYDRLLAGKTDEVSVGAYVITDDKPGDYRGKKYHATWLSTFGDHLAFLPGGRGACSVEMGCGTHRAAMCFEGDEIKIEEFRAACSCQDEPITAAKYKMEDCPSCKGSGNLNGNPCEACDGTGEIRAASISEMSESQSVNSPVIPPAAAKPQPRAAAAGCGCKTGVNKMDKNTKAEIIAALVTDRYSGFKEEDMAMLETASDARLEEFRASSEARKVAEKNQTRLENDLVATSARLKVAEDRLRAAEAPMTHEDFMRRAPEDIRALLEARKAEEDAERAAIISKLKDLGGNTEAELKDKSTSELKTLAFYARVEVPDFSGRGIPQERHAQDKTDYTPPDPYAAAVRALQAAGSKAVN